jgi:bifunctional DNA-binding transcriptional regulator/antitoxin component of YhaV-PrlF toxin-antitoxin module
MQIYRHVDSRGNLVLPKELRAGIDLVEIERRPDGVIELRPKVAIDADQAWFWTERWQKMEREADADIAAGRVVQTDNVEDLLKELDSEK